MFKSASLESKRWKQAFAEVDLHKSYCQALVCASEGEVLKEGRIATEPENIEEFFSGLEHLKIALEATSNYEYFYDLLESLGHRVVVAAHPLKMTRIAAATILAELLRGGLLPTAYVPLKKKTPSGQFRAL